MKRFTLIVLLSLSAASAFAQQQAKPSDAEISARINALRNQRDEANDRIVLLMGQLSDAQTKTALAEQEAAACKKPAEKK